MPWRVRKADVEYFKAELWKDLRSFPVARDPAHFAKDCFEPLLATKEALVLTSLQEKVGSGAVPEPIRVEGSVLLLERISGGRLFDIIRHLRQISTAHPDLGAEEALTTVLGRARERLRLVQLALVELTGLVSEEIYPFETKVASLLDMFVRILAIRGHAGLWRDQLADMADCWEAFAAIPFRDATTKNMFLAEPQLALTPGDDAESTQRASVERVLRTGPDDYWQTVPLVDVDFSSVVHLTSPEDDPLSLYCHQITYPLSQVGPADLVLDQSLGKPTPERAAVTAFIRYMRFGGRKLAYYLINPQGFKVRFAYDDPLFYFWHVAELCDDLCPGFTDRYDALFALVREIASAVAGASRADQELLTVDHLRKFGDVGHFWQQNPSELE